MTSQTTDGMPRLIPGGVAGSGLAVGQSRPIESRISVSGNIPAQAVPAASPGAINTPPTAVTGTWTTNVIVDASWSINEPRNAYFRVAGVGWKKVFNGSDGAFLALLTLVTQAKQTSRPVSLREEADGLVHEVYLW
jgi:hypothetical protein